MCQDRWQLSEHSHSNHARSGAQQTPRPKENDKRGNYEVWQNANSSECEVVPVVSGGGQNRERVLPAPESHPMHASEIRPECNRNTRQWCVLGFQRVRALVPPLDAASNMRRLVDGGV